jgi:glycosyltransferase involved in cell wall biosynthesis
MIELATLIIPCKDDHQELQSLLLKIITWKAVPQEIIIVDSSLSKIQLSLEFEAFAKKNSLSINIIFKKDLFPGHARNLGINVASHSTLAFLDSRTIPEENWLQDGLKLIRDSKAEGVWGSTIYNAKYFQAKIIRASTYGVNPLQTLPGSILKKNIFNKCGLFLENIRAGEDSDWINRAKLHRVNVSRSHQHLTYDAVNHLSILQLIMKWFRNYTHGGDLPVFKLQADLYFYGLSLIAIISAYNWNAVLAAWDMESIFYIPNITKISILIVGAAYVIFRGVLIPIKKGVSLRFIFPINFLLIATLSLAIDITKMIAFIHSRTH